MGLDCRVRYRAVDEVSIGDSRVATMREDNASEIVSGELPRPEVVALPMVRNIRVVD